VALSRAAESARGEGLLPETALERTAAAETLTRVEANLCLSAAPSFRFSCSAASACRRRHCCRRGTTLRPPLDVARHRRSLAQPEAHPVPPIFEALRLALAPCPSRSDSESLAGSQCPRNSVHTPGDGRNSRCLCCGVLAAGCPHFAAAGSPCHSRRMCHCPVLVERADNELSATTAAAARSCQLCNLASLGTR
jgi:hypothetical protein